MTALMTKICQWALLWQLESGSFTLSAATLNLAHLSASIYEIPGICPTHFDLCDFTYSTLQLNYFNMAWWNPNYCEQDNIFWKLW